MKKPGVKERIIDTASRLFYYEGFNQTGINRIIEEAGVAEPTEDIFPATPGLRS